MKYAIDHLEYLKTSYGYVGYRSIFLLAIILLGGITEVIGIALLLPILELESGSAKHSQLSEFVYSGFDLFNIEVSMLSLLILIILTFCFKGMIVYARMFLAERILCNFILALRTKITEALAQISFVHYAQVKSGTMTNLMFAEVDRVARSFSKYISVIATVIVVVFYLLGAAAIRPDVTIGIILVGLLAIFLLRFLVRHTRRLSLNTSTVNTVANSEMIQLLHSFQYLKISGSLPRMTLRLVASLKESIRLRIVLAMISASLHAVIEPIAVLVLAILIFYQVVIAGDPLAEIIVLALLCHRAFTRLMAVQQEVQRFNESVGGVVTLSRELKLLEDNHDTDGSRELTTISDDIEFDNVSFSYGAIPAAVNLSMTIPRNQTVGIVGESGAGKSTLILMLAGVIKPTTGSIRIGNVDYLDVKRDSLHRKMGFVTQDPVVFNGSVAENITLFGDAGTSAEEVKKVQLAACQAKCEEFILDLEHQYDTEIGERGVNLSGGQKQRIAIAREIYKSPELMIFDEATSALDTVSEKAIQQSIAEMHGERTIVIIAHRLSTIRHCDKIVVMSQGRVIESGTFQSLTSDTTSKFHELVEAQRL